MSKLRVTLQSTYKYAVHEEVYEVDLSEFTEEELEDFKEDYDGELGNLVLHGYGECISTSILETGGCQDDTIISTKEIQNEKD